MPALALAGCQSDTAGEERASGTVPAGQPDVPHDTTSPSVIRLSVSPDTGDDVTEAFEEALEQVHPTLATTILLDRGEYLVRAITIPPFRTVIIRGAGTGYVGGSVGTRIRRSDDGTGPLLLAQGETDSLGADELSSPDFRTRLELRDLELHGNETAGAVLRVFRGQQCHFEGIRVSKSTGTAVHLTQMFNSSISRMFVGYSGRGRSAPAMLVDGTDEGAPAGTNTLHITDCEWETNAGTDLSIDGFPGMPSVGVLVAGAKMERNTGDFPLIQVTENGKIQLSNSYLYLGSGTEHHQVETAGSAMLSNVHLAHGSTPDYQVVHADGLLMMTGVHSEALLRRAVVRVAPEVSAGRCVIRGLTSIDGKTLVHDERDLPVRMGQRVVPLQIVHATATTELVEGASAAGWALGSSGTDDVCVGQAVMPEELAVDADCELVLRWTTGGGDSGGVVLGASVGGLAVEGSLASGRKSVEARGEAPDSSGTLVESVLSPSLTVAEGDLVQVRIGRDTDHPQDTFSGDVLLLTAHLLVSGNP